MRALLKIASAAALATALVGSANAAVYVFNFQGNDNSNTVGTLGNVRTATATSGSTSLDLRVTGWNFSGGSTYASYLGNYPLGLGVKNDASDNHFADSFGATDFYLIQFSRPVTLTSAVFNAYGSPSFHQSLKDSDATIRIGQPGLIWTANPFANGASQASVLSMFPASFASYVTTNSSSPRPLASGGQRSNAWIIEAGGVDSLIDGFKIGQLTASAVPEPGTWAMMILGFGMVGASMRSRRKLSSIQVRYAF